MTIVITLDQNGEVTNIPSFAGAHDPVQFLFADFPFPEKGRRIPRLQRLSVKVLGITWDTPHDMSNEEMDSKAFEFSDITCGENNGRFDGFTEPLAELIIVDSPAMESGLHAALTEFYGHCFFGGTLKNRGFRDDRWNQICKIFKEKARDRRMWTDAEKLAAGRQWLHCVGEWRKHHAYVVLELFQEAFNQPLPSHFFLPRTANPNAEPVEGSDVGFNGVVEHYASQSGILAVFDALKATVIELHGKFGISP